MIKYTRVNRVGGKQLFYLTLLTFAILQFPFIVSNRYFCLLAAWF